MYDTAVPESRRKNIEELEELRREAWNLGQEDFGSVKLQKRFEGMEKAVWLGICRDTFLPRLTVSRPGGNVSLPNEGTHPSCFSVAVLWSCWIGTLAVRVCSKTDWMCQSPSSLTASLKGDLDRFCCSDEDLSAIAH
jgi:hypothetical protein